MVLLLNRSSGIDFRTRMAISTFYINFDTFFLYEIHENFMIYMSTVPTVFNLPTDMCNRQGRGSISASITDAW